MTATRVVPLLALLVIGIALGWIFARNLPAPPARSGAVPSAGAPDAAALRGLAQRVDALEERLAFLEAQRRTDPGVPPVAAAPPSRARAEAVPAPARPAEPRPDPKPSQAPQRTADGRPVSERWRAIESDFDRQRVDARFSSEAGKALRAAFDPRSEEHAALAASVLDAVDCRTSLCRVEVVFDEKTVDRTALQFELAVSAGALLPKMTGVYSEQPDGKVRATFFLARADHEFPGVAAPPPDGER
jgi:hypothetical protein